MNLGHDRIMKEDISKACSAFSNDLLAEIDLEIRDVFPSAEHLLYAFIGSSKELRREDLLQTAGRSENAKRRCRCQADEGVSDG